jgi:hypothetical protein
MARGLRLGFLAGCVLALAIIAVLELVQVY